MAINQNDGFIQTTTVGGETTIDFDFEIETAADLRVLLTSPSNVVSTLVNGTHYSVPSGSLNDPDGGTINILAGAYPTGLPAGYKVTCLSDYIEARSSDFQQGGDFFAGVLNQQLDRLTVVTQQLRRDVDKSAQFRSDINIPTCTIIAAPVDGRALIASGTSGDLTFGPNATDIANAQTYASQAAASAATATSKAAQAAASAALLPLNNYTATTDPTVNDDSGDGYSAGSLWVNTTSGDSFRCTSAAVGAAVWVSQAADLSSLGDMAYETAADYVLQTQIPTIRSIPQNSKSADYTLVLADQGGHILHPTADTSARTFTIPANASVAYPIGTALTFVNQNGAGSVSIAITSDTMRLAGAGTTGTRTLAANGMATALKVTATEWIISGTGLT